MKGLGVFSSCVLLEFCNTVGIRKRRSTCCCSFQGSWYRSNFLTREDLFLLTASLWRWELADLKSVTSTMEASKLLVCILKSARLPNLMLALNGKIVTRNSWLLGCNSAPSFLLLLGSLLLLVYLGRKESLGISCSQSKTSTVRYSPWCRSSHGIWKQGSSCKL